MPYRQIVGVGHDGRVVIDDPDPSLLSAHTVLTTGAHGIGGQWFQTYLQRGVSRAGITAGQAGYFFEEFTDMSRWYKALGIPNAVARTDVAGGVASWTLDVDTTVRYVAGSAAYRTTLAKLDQPFYFAVRMRFPLGLPMPVDHYGTIGYLNITANAGAVIWAGHGLPWGGATIVGGGMIDWIPSSVAVDSNWHNFEMWHDGIAYFVSVDDEVPVSAASLPHPTSYGFPTIIQIRSGAPDFQMQIDKGLWLYPQAT